MSKAAAEVSRGAWVRAEDKTYGAGRYPFGPCSECADPACHRVPHANDNGSRLVCMRHKPKIFFFLPFLGQQEKLFLATERWVLAGGGAGGAKTFAGSRLWLKQWRTEQERYLRAKTKGRTFQSKGWAIFFRRTMPELLQVIEDFKKYFKKVDPAARWNEQQKLAVFSNGYKVQFGGMEDESGYLRFYGGEYTLVVFDEATQFTKKQIVELDARLRCSDPILDKQVQLYLLTNPVGGETKAWLKKRYVRRAPPETPIKVQVKLADGRVITEWQVYIPSNIYDNPALVASGRYEASLSLKGAAMKRALLLNDWDVDEGCWVGELWDPRIHVLTPHAIPKTWTKFKCADWGHSSRGSIMWFAVDHDGGLVCYRAWSFRLMTARQVAARIKQIESIPLKWRDPAGGKTVTVTDREWNEADDCSMVPGPMDAACWNKTGDELSIGEVLETAGTGFHRSQKGTTVRHSAANNIRERLQMRHADAAGKLDPGVAGLRFFRGTTETTIMDNDGTPSVTGPIHTIPVLPFDPDDPDVWDTNADDHDMDALAYGAMSRPMPGEEREDAEVLDFMSLKLQGLGSGPVEKISW